MEKKERWVWNGYEIARVQITLLALQYTVHEVDV